MNEKLLHKSNDVFSTEYIVDVLKTNGITCYKHDEKASQRTGAYGPDEGIAIYVAEEDYDRAKEIIQPILAKKAHHSSTYCPKCGSENIDVLPNPAFRYRSGMLIICLLSMFFPIVYFAWDLQIAEIATPTGNVLAIISLLLSIVLMFLSRKTKSKYRCLKCGKIFTRP